MKNILLIATGGTIASAEDGNGLSPALTGEQLAQAVPQIAGMCQLDIVQPMNIDSTNMRPQDWMRIRDVIMDGYDTHDGFVVLHGTDTMSYTRRGAFLPDPEQRQAHRPHRLAAAHGAPFYGRQAQLIPKPAIRHR